MSKQNIEEYHPIGMVAKMYKISVATLRMYEDKGLLIPKKSKGRHRLYNDFDIQRVKCIRKMIEEKGLNIAGIRMLLSAIPCWELKPCSEEDRKLCDAYHLSDKPCWLVENKGEACKNENCRECPVYLESTRCSSIKNILNLFWRRETNEQAI